MIKRYIYISLYISYIRFKVYDKLYLINLGQVWESKQTADV